MTVDKADRQRQPFEPSLWRRSKFKHFNTAVEQVWFPGAHADIGGGYVNEERRSRDRLDVLDDLTLDWMIKRLKHYFPDFPISEAGWVELTAGRVRETAMSVQHQSRAGYYLVWPRAFRSLNNVVVACRHIPVLRPFSEVNVGRDRHEEPTDEMVHISSLLRWQAEIMIGRRTRTYSPKNLHAVLATVAANYDGLTAYLPIVDWDGIPLDPKTEDGMQKASAYFKAIKSATPSPPVS